MYHFLCASDQSERSVVDSWVVWPSAQTSICPCWNSKPFTKPGSEAMHARKKIFRVVFDWRTCARLKVCARLKDARLKNVCSIEELVLDWRLWICAGWENACSIRNLCSIEELVLDWRIASGLLIYFMDTFSSFNFTVITHHCDINSHFQNGIDNKFSESNGTDLCASWQVLVRLCMQVCRNLMARETK